MNSYYIRAKIENVVNESRFSHTWGPFNTRKDVKNWVHEFLNRLVEEYVITDFFVLHRPKPPKSARQPDDFDGGPECLLYSGNTWHLPKSELDMSMEWENG